LVAFLMLVLGSAAVTTVSLRALETDAVVINLAGRQRMLIQEMGRYALETEKYAEAGTDSVNVVALREAANTFDQTLAALLDGGSAPYLDGQFVILPAAADPGVRAKLESVRSDWTFFKRNVDALLSISPASPLTSSVVAQIETGSLTLLANVDRSVRLFEAASERRVAYLRLILATFFGGAVLLLATGYWITWRNIVQPVRALETAARRMADDDLTTPIVPSGEDEIGKLTHSLDVTRSKLAESRHKLERWAAKLETRVAARTRELATLLDVSAEINAQRKLDEVLNTVVQKAGELLDSEVGVLCLLDDESQELRAAAFFGPNGVVKERAQLVTEGIARDVVLEGQTTDCVNGCGCQILQPGFQPCQMAAPLRASDKIVGALCVADRSRRTFGAAEKQVLTLLANTAGIALENARLHELSEKLAILGERERISTEMHDGLAQTLGFLNLRADQLEAQLEAGETIAALRSVDGFREAVESAYAHVRGALSGLRAPRRTTAEFETRLAKAAVEFEQVAGLPVEFVARDRRALQVSPEAQVQVVQIVKEALTNVRRHARATQATLAVETHNAEAVFSIVDNGLGFDPAALVDSPNHWGLEIMRTRAERSGGYAVIQSTPGAGARVSVYYPLDLVSQTTEKVAA